MNYALRARRLGIAKRTFVEPKKGVPLQVSAFITEPACPVVSVVAVKLNHRADGLLFALEPREQFTRHNPTPSFPNNKGTLRMNVSL
jgi:hypothetical protein